MKAFILNLIGLILSHTVFASSDTIDIKVSNSFIRVDQTIPLQFGMEFKLQFSDTTVELDDEYFLSNKPTAIVHYKGLRENNYNKIQTRFLVSSDGTTGKFTTIGFNIENVDINFVNYFLETGDNSISVRFESDVIVRTSEKGKYGRIAKETLNNSISTLSLTTAQRNELLLNPIGYYNYQNNFDFGVQPKDDKNNSTRYFFTLKKISKYGSVKQDSHLFWSIDTRVSTDFADSLNFIKFYPLNLSWRSKDYTNELMAKVGHESNQTFDNKRLAADVNFSFMIGNIINLVGNEPRIRPKPIINIGLKGYYDYSNDQPHFASGQAFVNGHYYIPIYDRYSLILDGNVFYDFSKQNNPSRKVRGNYSIEFGIEVPKTPFTALFKYVDGKTDINYKDGQIIGLGLLMGLFSK